MSVRADYKHRFGGSLGYYDPATQETLDIIKPVRFYDDFVGSAGGDTFDGTIVWNVVDVASATEAIVADSANGVFKLHMAAASEAQDAVLYQNNNRNFKAGNGLIFETRIDFGVAPGTGVAAVLGMAGDHNLDKDAVAEHAWFRLDASMAIKVETDDTTNDNDDVATGITAVAGTYNVFRIDFTDLEDVRFYIDGNRVAAATTFDMSNLTTAEEQMQPYFSLDKASGTGLGDMNIDYVKCWSDRS